MAKARIDIPKDEIAAFCRRNRIRRWDLGADRRFCLALTHLVEIVGEAAARVSPEGRDRWQTIPWRSVVGLLDRLRHTLEDKGRRSGEAQRF